MPDPSKMHGLCVHDFSMVQAHKNQEPSPSTSRSLSGSQRWGAFKLKLAGADCLSPAAPHRRYLQLASSSCLLLPALLPAWPSSCLQFSAGASMLVLTPHFSLASIRAFLLIAAWPWYFRRCLSLFPLNSWGACGSPDLDSNDSTFLCAIPHNVTVSLLQDFVLKHETKMWEGKCSFTSVLQHG